VEHMFRWSKQIVLQRIKARAEAERPLCYSAVVAEEEVLIGAARRLFGSWGVAVQDAGIDYQEVKKAARRKPREPAGTWTEEKIIGKIKARAKAGLPLNPHAVQIDDAKLYSAAAGLFGSWSRAVEAAGLNHEEVSRTVRWSKVKILEMICAAAKQGRLLKITNFPESFRSAVMDHFGSWEAALNEAGYGEKTWQEKDRGLKNNIRKYRLERGLSEAELGKKMGVSHRTISMLELGQYADPRVSFAVKLARALGCRVEDLFGTNLLQVHNYCK